MKNLFYFLLLIILLLSNSCILDKPALDGQLIENEINEMLEAYIKHVNTKGLVEVEDYFSIDDRFYWVEDGVLQYPNRKALTEGIEAFAPSVTSINLEIFKKEITILNNQTAMLYMEYKEDLMINSGFIVKLDGAMTILTIKKNDSWKFLIGHSSIKKKRGGD